MTFLPIAGRELRVSARKRSTFWLRLVAALVACVVALFMFAEIGSWRGVSDGKALFATLTWLAFAATLSAGLFLTSDCLSEEKREGTLGLLFLTDLRGHDIAFGKLLATSLQGLCALLAIVPILAMTLLMGGVTGAQFWKAILALFNALWISLAAGMFVSAISRESQKALGGTLLVLLLVAGATALVDSAIAKGQGRAFTPMLTRASPVYLFMLAGSWAQKSFWPEFFANQVVGWTLFAAACLLLPRVWQERVNESVNKKDWRYAWKFGRSKNRVSRRTKLLDRNPVVWLACRERWQAAVLGAVTLGIVAYNISLARKPNTVWAFWNFVGSGFILVLYLGITSQATRLFAETKRSGFLELLLVTPVTVKEVVQGQWRGLLRSFGLPLALWLLVGVATAFVGYQQMVRQMAAVTAPARAVAVGTNASSNTTLISSSTVITTTVTVTAGSTPILTTTAPGPRGYDLIIFGIALAATLATAANLAALSWFGMWMGLNSKSANLATLKTLLFVQVIPWFVITFASWTVIPMFLFSGIRSGGPSNWMFFWPLLQSAVASVLCLVKDVGFISLSRRKLYADFRSRALPSAAPISLALPPKVAALLKPYEEKRLDARW